MKSTDDSAANAKSQQDPGALDQLLEQVRGLKSREGIVAVCDIVIRLREFAPFNAMLIYMQRPNATHVLGALAWREMKRFPKPGSHPLVILWPFAPVQFVFDVGDTEGDPVPEQLKLGNLDGNAFAANGTLSHEALFRFMHHCAKFGVSVVERKEHLMKAGHVRRLDPDFFEIELNVDHRPAQKFCTLCHELAHILCGHLGPAKGLAEDRPPVGQLQRETEAELSAYLAAMRFGITPNSANYLDWYSNPQGTLPEFSLETVLVVVGKIEALIRGDLRRKK